jgi:hypothetical protein
MTRKNGSRFSSILLKTNGRTRIAATREKRLMAVAGAGELGIDGIIFDYFLGRAAGLRPAESGPERSSLPDVD